MTTADAPEWYREVVTRQAPPQRDAGPPTTASAADPRSLLAAAPAYTGPQAGAAAAPHWGLATQAAQKHGLDPSLLAAVWDFESSGNPGAVNKSSGATGLGQVMPRERGFPDRPTKRSCSTRRRTRSGRRASSRAGWTATAPRTRPWPPTWGRSTPGGTSPGRWTPTGRGATSTSAPCASASSATPARAPAQGPVPLPRPRPLARRRRRLVPRRSGEVPGAAASRAEPRWGGGRPAEASVKQAQAASWALSNLGSKAYLAPLSTVHRERLRHGRAIPLSRSGRQRPDQDRRPRPGRRRRPGVLRAVTQQRQRRARRHLSGERGDGGGHQRQASPATTSSRTRTGRTSSWASVTHPASGRAGRRPPTWSRAHKS